RCKYLASDGRSMTPFRGATATLPVPEAYVRERGTYRHDYFDLSGSKAGTDDAGPAEQLRVRGPAGLRARRAIRSRQCTVAAAADADVRPHQRNYRKRW